MGIKGPLTTPIGGGIRSLNVALRKALDLYVCQRPVRYFAGVPSPVKHPEYVDMVIFRENTEDIYAGIEFEYGHGKQPKVHALAEGSISQLNMKRCASQKQPGLVSSRCLRRARSGWCVPPFNGHLKINAARSPWCIKEIS